RPGNLPITISVKARLGWRFIDGQSLRSFYDGLEKHQMTIKDEGRLLELTLDCLKERKLKIEASAFKI
ncbi:MAG: hypothetical protein ACRC45_00670, partial [Cetobacterium sp.]